MMVFQAHPQSIREGRDKAEKMIAESKTREQLETARRYVAQFKSLYVFENGTVDELEKMLEEKDTLMFKEEQV